MRTIKRDIVGAFIFSSDDKLLIGKSRKGGVYTDKWIIPGGGIDEGETKLAALYREVMEETGLDITNAEIKEVDGALSGESEKILKESNERVLVDMTFYNYTIKLTDPADKITVITEDDFIDAKWVPVSELHSLPLSPPSVITLQKLGYLPETY